MLLTCVRKHGMTAEFDEYASNYDAGMNHPLKAILGSSAKSYLHPKAVWVVNYLAYLKRNQKCKGQGAVRLLEVGCGIGSFLECLHLNHFTGELYGADTSKLMLEQAKKNCEHAIFSPTFSLIESCLLPYPDGFFEIVVACALLHHVQPGDRKKMFDEFKRVLVPGGVLVVFEHNPWNLVTQIVVRTTAIDKHAKLLSANHVRELAVKSGFSIDREEYMMFFPPRWSFLSGVEKFLVRFPFGGQFAIAGRTPEGNFKKTF